MKWLSVIGLCFDIVGSSILVWGLIISKEKAIELGLSRLSGDTDEENIELPQVADRLRQSKNAKIGLFFLALLRIEWVKTCAGSASRPLLSRA